MILLFSLIIFFLSQKNDRLLWLLLPLSVFMDLWNTERIGNFGLRVLLITGVLLLVFGTKVEQNHKLKI